MSPRNAVQRGFDRFGREAGFEKKSGSWYKRGTSVIAIANLQKSQYSPRYYFNQGFWLREVEDIPFPASHRAHIGLRLGGLLPDCEARINELLDLDVPMPDEQRVDEIVALLNDRLLPIINRADSVEALRKMSADGALSSALIMREAQEAMDFVAQR